MRFLSTLCCVALAATSIQAQTSAVGAGAGAGVSVPLVGVGVGGGVGVGDFPSDVVSSFTSWLSLNHKSYSSPDEYIMRLSMYNQTYHRVQRRNNNNNNNMQKSQEKNINLKINHLADLTPQEWKQRLGVVVPPQNNTNTNTNNNNNNKNNNNKLTSRDRLESLLAVSVPDYPSSLDWYGLGMVTGVKNQGGCGSCTTFSATGLIESALAIAGHPLISLSEQELLDCSGKVTCSTGGWTPNVINAATQQYGLQIEDTYPYTAQQGTCQANTWGPHLGTNNVIPGVQTLDLGEASLMRAIQHGPVSVNVAAGNIQWQDYAGGVLRDPNCGTKIDHAVLVVGYGTDPQEGDYWLVKNSWGTGWGENGFIRLARGTNVWNDPSICGLSYSGMYQIQVCPGGQQINCQGVCSAHLPWSSHGTRINDYDQTDAPPNLAQFNNQLYFAFKGLNNGIYITSSPDGTSWSSSATRINNYDQTDAAPKLVQFNNKLYLAFKGLNNGIYIASSSDGTSWSRGTRINNYDQTDATPNLVQFNNKLYLAFKGLDTGIYIVSSSDGTSWPSSSTRINNEDQTDVAPNLAQFNNKLYLAFKGLNNGIYIASSSDGTSWSRGTRINNYDQTDATPNLAQFNFNNKLYLAFKGLNNGIYIASSCDGTSWTSSRTRINNYDQTDVAPNLAQFNNKPYLAFKGLNKGIYIVW